MAEYPDTTAGWTRALAEALRVLIDDESRGTALRTLAAYDAWEKAKQPRVRLPDGHVGVLVDVYTTPHGDYAVVQVDDVMYDVPLDEVEPA